MAVSARPDFLSLPFPSLPFLPSYLEPRTVQGPTAVESKPYHGPGRPTVPLQGDVVQCIVDRLHLYTRLVGSTGLCSCRTHSLIPYQGHFTRRTSLNWYGPCMALSLPFDGHWTWLDVSLSKGARMLGFFGHIRSTAPLQAVHIYPGQHS